MAVQLAAPSEDYPYQVSESLRQRLDLVHHLVEFGRQVIIVRGPRGSGRSRLLRTIAEEAAGDWLAVLVDGGGHVSAAAFARAWGETLGAAMDEDVGNLAGLREALQRLGRQRRRCVLLVDDADALEDEAVGLLQAIANDPLDYADTRVVLAVEDDDEDDFAAFFEEGVSGVGLVHVVEVPPLDLAGIRGLAAAWSTLIGLPASVVLPEDAVETVAAESDGRPGRVLECLAGRLERGQPSEQEIFGGFELPARLKRVGGITVLILAALGLVALALSQREGAPRQAERQGPTVIDLDLPGRAEATASASPGTADAAAKPAQAGAITANLPARTDTRSASPPAAAAGAAPQVTPAEDAPADTAPAPTSPPTPLELVPATAVAAPVAAADDTPTPAPAPPAAPSATPTPPPAAARPAPARPAATPGEPAPAAAETTVVAKEAPKKQAYEAKWVLTQKASAYVVQVFGGSTRAAAEKFLRGQPALHGRAAIIDLERNGAPWHVVIWGLFPDRAAAAAAVATLPAAVRATGPWPRSVGSLTE